ncbi:Protein of unknown function [Gryllus bimaculatus]|nr:Protein of unknown function [Gryllus bimaculatus]
MLTVNKRIPASPEVGPRGPRSRLPDTRWAVAGPGPRPATKTTCGAALIGTAAAVSRRASLAAAKALGPRGEPPPRRATPRHAARPPSRPGSRGLLRSGLRSSLRSERRLYVGLVEAQENALGSIRGSLPQGARDVGERVKPEHPEFALWRLTHRASTGSRRANLRILCVGVNQRLACEPRASRRAYLWNSGGGVSLNYLTRRHLRPRSHSVCIGARYNLTYCRHTVATTGLTFGVTPCDGNCHGTEVRRRASRVACVFCGKAVFRKEKVAGVF